MYLNDGQRLDPGRSRLKVKRSELAVRSSNGGSSCRTWSGTDTSFRPNSSNVSLRHEPTFARSVTMTHLTTEARRLLPLEIQPEVKSERLAV